MTTAQVLNKEKIVSMSQLQKNPAQALNADIVRIVKNGKEIGIFMSKEEFEDFIEEHLEIKPEVKKALNKAVQKSKKAANLVELYSDEQVQQWLHEDKLDQRTALKLKKIL